MLSFRRRNAGGREPVRPGPRAFPAVKAQWELREGTALVPLVPQWELRAIDHGQKERDTENRPLSVAEEMGCLSGKWGIK